MLTVSNTYALHRIALPSLEVIYRENIWIESLFPEAELEGQSQTPSTGLRHPSLEEGAGKRCSECETDAAAAAATAAAVSEV